MYNYSNLLLVLLKTEQRIVLHACTEVPSIASLYYTCLLYTSGLVQNLLHTAHYIIASCNSITDRFQYLIILLPDRDDKSILFPELVNGVLIQWCETTCSQPF